MPLPKDPVKKEKWIYKQRKIIQKRFKDPEYRRKNKERLQKLAQDPDHRRKIKEAALKRFQNPEQRRKNKESREKMYLDPVWQHNHKLGIQKRSQNPEWQRKQKEKNQRIARNENRIRNNIESQIGGFWYGNVRYSDRKQYCERWCPDLWRRIDEAQNYQSVLSGKTKFENEGRSLSRHHVYWQPKACCEWDEDVSGYYAWINVGTVRKPNKVKYYIKGDPNKFVLLTMSEHQMIKTDKLKWIEIFEELVETKLGGICYLPKVVK